MIRRVKRAFRLKNEPQASSCIMLTGLMVASAFAGNAPWWGVLVAASFWPLVVFFVNFLDND